MNWGGDLGVDLGGDLEGDLGGDPSEAGYDDWRAREDPREHGSPQVENVENVGMGGVLEQPDVGIGRISRNTRGFLGVTQGGKLAFMWWDRLGGRIEGPLPFGDVAP